MAADFRKWAYLTLCVFAAALTACQQRTATSEPLRIQLGSEPASLDPALAEDGASLRVLFNTMEGLVGYDGEGKLRNWMAESHSVSPDGLRYEFTLRPQAKWSDDKPVTAADFVTGIRRALAPGSGSKLAGMLGPIQDVRDEGGKLVIVLRRRTPYFLQVLSLPVALPQRKDVLDANGGRWPETAPANGPYRVAEHRADRSFRFEPNPHYWDPGKPRPEVEILVVSDDTTGVNLFAQGKLDVLTKVPAADLKRLRAEGRVHTDPFLATYYLSFNLRKPPFNDRDWRRAVSGSVHRAELVQALDTGDRPARSWVPPGLEGYVEYSDPAPAFADSLKAVRAKGPPRAPVAAAFDSGSRNAVVMEKVQQDLRKALDLRTSLNNLDWKAYLKSVQTDPPPLFRLGILSPFLDPVQILQSFTTGDPNNYLKWSNAEFDRLVGEISGLEPGPARAAKARQAQEILVDREAAVVPLFHYVQNHAVSKRVRGFRVNPFGVIRFNELGVEK